MEDWKFFAGEQLGTQGATPFNPMLPVETRDGRPARILATDMLGAWPIAAAVRSDCGPLEHVGLFKENGWACPGKESHCDLINVPGETRPIAGYFGIYRTLAEDQLRASPEESVSAARSYLGIPTEAVWLRLTPLSTPEAPL